MIVVLDMMVRKGLLQREVVFDEKTLLTRMEKVTKYMNYAWAKGQLEY